MKTNKILLLTIIVCTLILILNGCVLDTNEEEYCFTFEEVSQPYFDQYGLPEDIHHHKFPGYHIVDCWWWSQDFNVTFLWTTYDDVCGWTVLREM